MHIIFRRYFRGRYGPHGFTIVELMMATAVFGIILLVVAVGVLRFTSDYYKGIASSKTQAAARDIMAEVAGSIQFSKVVTVIPLDSNGYGGLCVDNALYAYRLGWQVTDTSPNALNYQEYHGLVVNNPGTCAAGAPAALVSTQTLPSGARELLGQRMRLNMLEVTPSGNLYTIHVRVIYGDYDLLVPAVTSGTSWATTTESCTGGAGAQFCAVSDLTTTVERRLL